jgi:hypothetical protein
MTMARAVCYGLDRASVMSDDPQSNRRDEPSRPHVVPPLRYAEPDTPRPPFRSDEVESWADVARAMGIVMLVLVFLFLVIAAVCGGLL